MESTLSHLECGWCRAQYDPDRLWNLCPACQRPLLARYDLDQAARRVSPKALAARPPGLWRYAELLPVRNPRYRLTLGEGGTPLLPLHRLGQRLGLRHLYAKDESFNPTASFKARGLCVAVSRAVELGAQALAVPSAGNAGSALAAYASRAGVSAHIVLPRDAPPAFRVEMEALGAHVTLVDGVITDCARVVQAGAAEGRWFDVSTLKEPYRLEGKKTMGYELAEQFGWRLPDFILYPTGGGTGLIGLWKAFDELERLGWVEGPRPRMVAVQSSGCAPIVRAFETGAEVAAPWPNPSTVAAGLRVPAAVGDFLMLRVIRESNGMAVAVSDAEILAAMRELGATEGIFAAPEAAATVAALHHLVKAGQISADDRVVLLLTGSGLKYTHLFDTSATP